jgi:probable HAF family extracellular repeat protein
MGQMTGTSLVKVSRYQGMLSALILLWAFSCPTGSYAQSAQLYWLGAPIGGRSVATDVSNSGIVVGYVQTSSGTHYPFYWHVNTGMQTLNQAATGGANAVEELHSNRFMMVGGVSQPPSTFLSTAFSWRSNWTQIRYDLGSTLSNAFDIGPKAGGVDDRYVVGWANYAGLPHAAYWISREHNVTGPFYIETDPNRRSYALAIGNIAPHIVGRITDAEGNWRAFYWDGLVDADRDIHELGTLGGCCGAAEDVSATGNVIVGWAYDANNRIRAVRWNRSPGAYPQDLGTLGGNESLAYSVDDSGYVIVGTAQRRNSQDFYAVMWLGSSIQDLNSLVSDQLLHGSRLIEATAISPNARYIVGWGYNSATGRNEAFMIDLASSMPGDVDGDGCVNDSDLLAVLFAFGNAGGQEDINRDGVVDDADLLEVLFHFGEGQC